jgi:formylglycine-generating enzyme required for sulfatase activity
MRAAMVAGTRFEVSLKANVAPLVFRFIPPGEFLMGARGFSPREEPAHRVRIERPFWLGETPVTNEQYAVFHTGAEIPAQTSFSSDPNSPKTMIGWDDAIRFCRWLSRDHQRHFPSGKWLTCLPTEAEWEYACRAGSETEFNTGDGIGALETAGCFGQPFAVGSTGTVGRKSPNGWGLRDMHGCVFECCHDPWVEAGYRDFLDPAIDPGRETRGEELEAWNAGFSQLNRYRVIRGGAWNASAWNCRSAARAHLDTAMRRADVGFRVCMTEAP